MTPKQISMVRLLMEKAKVLKQKADIAYSFSDGRTLHLSELNHEETVALVAYLRSLTGQSANPSDKMRRKIMSIAHELGWEEFDGRVDIERINKWLSNSTAQKKPLDELSHKELAQVVSQIEIVYKKFLKAI